MNDSSTRHSLPTVKKFLRFCISCRGYFAKESMIRICYCKYRNIFSFNNDPILKGRSAYICENDQCIQTALKAKKVQRSLKRAVSDDILNNLNRELEGLKNQWLFPK
ncbi:MAG: YlxR family protein [Cyanobacteria bacterium]|nr:YlxR family protein [Cyanobacteriota bacterium]